MNRISNCFIARYLWSQLFIFCLLFSVLNSSWVYLSFRIHQKRIAETLCVKREIKGNTCQGKCHLRIQLKQTAGDEKQQDTKVPRLKLVPFVYTLIEQNRTSISPRVAKEAKANFHYFRCTKWHWKDGVFHPPQDRRIQLT